MISFLILVLFSGLRSFTVGTDTSTYVYFFNLLNFDQNIFNDGFLSFLFSEPGFKSVQLFSKLIIDDYHLVMLFIASIVVFLNINVISKYSLWPVLSFFLFLTIGYYTFHFNVARQGITVAIFFFSIRYIYSQNLIKYLACIFCGFFFHKSILLCLPCYYLYNKQFKVTYVIVLCSVVILVSGFLESFVSYASTNIDERYANFAATQNESRGVIEFLFNLSIFVFLWITRIVNSVVTREFSFLLYLSLIGVMIGFASVLLSLDPNGVARASIYFTQAYILLVPHAILQYKSILVRTIITVVLVITASIYFILRTKYLGDLTPYIFIN
ncbi:EpsG family protein [Vibrio breoganii]|uniref:EpsG family protein n=1 Tax=Vibrio breoganii TaxID=553239 RepID=UPI00354D9892